MITRSSQIGHSCISFAILALIFSSPTPVSSQSQTLPEDTSPGSSPLELSNCYFNAEMQPTKTMEMNTIATEDIVKTIFLEKKTFVCKSQFRQTILADVSTFAGLVDNLLNQTALLRNLEVVTCLEDINLTRMDCTSERPPTDLPTSGISCSLTKQFKHPVLLNTIVGSDNTSKLLKNIEADGRVFSCRDSDTTQLIKTVTTFTSTYEDLDKNLVNRSIENVLCMTEVVNLQLAACQFQKII